jgi:16S rRNA (guanine527-N7)-methyltransferase
MSEDPGLARSLARGAEELELHLSPGQRDRLLAYLALLARWNRTYNLTAVRDPAQMVPRHLLDCLSLVPLLHGERLLDVGSGGGLPGLVLAVAVPTLDTTLLDASLKRTRFLNHAVQTLGIANVRVVRARLEAYCAGACFDTVTARASLSLASLLESAPRLLASGGRLLAMLGRAPAPAPRAPPGFSLRIAQLRVPSLDAQRHVAVLESS